MKILLSLVFGLVFGLVGLDFGTMAASWTLSPSFAGDKVTQGNVVSQYLNAIAARCLKVFRKTDMRWDEIASSLALQVRAGNTPVDAIKEVSKEDDSPSHKVLRRAYRLYETGMPIFSALAVASNKDPELTMIANVLEIGSVTGGNMAELTWHVFELIRKKRFFQGEIKAKLSEARITAAVLSLMPWLVGIFTFRSNQIMFRMFLNSAQGKILFILAAVLWVLGNILILLFLRSLSPGKRLSFSVTGQDCLRGRTVC